MATSGAIAGTRTVSLQWIAYRTVSSGAYEKEASIPMWTTGTKCIREDFPKVSTILKKLTSIQRRNFTGCNIKIAKKKKIDEIDLCLLVFNIMHFSPINLRN